MEKKPNITPTPWMVMENKKDNEFAIKEKDLFRDGQWMLSDRICTMGHYTTQNENNAQAIVTAVNCTYGKGIDPEKIGEVLRCLEGIIKTNGNIAVNDPIWLEATLALKHIKYVD